MSSNTTGAINSTTGIFTVTDPGNYQLHFQAAGGIEKEHEWFYCTIYVDDKVSGREQYIT